MDAAELRPGAQAAVHRHVGDFARAEVPAEGLRACDISIYRPSNGVWYIRPASGAAPYSKGWGLPGDLPVPDDYDYDRKTDLAVWRPSNGVFYIIPSLAPTTFVEKGWGMLGDYNVPPTATNGPFR